MKPLHYINIIAIISILTGCQKPEPEKIAHPEHLSNLNVFLGIRSLRADYQLPRGIGAYYPVVFFFHAGQLVETAKGPGLISIQADNQLPTNVQLDLMWQVVDGTFRKASLVDGLNEHELTKRFAFWDKIKSYSMCQVRPEEDLRFGGAKILGIVASSENEQVSLNTHEIAKSGTYVIAVGIVTAKSRQEIVDQFLKK